MRDLRNIYKEIPDLKKVGKAYNKEHIKARTTKKGYKVLMGSKSSKWTTFKKDFTAYTKNRCAICEREITQYDDIEHYRPKNKEMYWWLAFDYRNYYICCKLCNTTYKGKEFPLLDPSKRVTFKTKAKIKEEKPLLFNPLKDNPLDLFKLEIYDRIPEPNGESPQLKIVPKSKDKDSYEYQKAATTIQVFNLNNDSKIDEKGNFISDGARTQTMIILGTDLRNFLRIYKRFKQNKAKEEELKEASKDLKDKGLDHLLKFILTGQYKYIMPTK